MKAGRRFPVSESEIESEHAPAKLPGYVVATGEFRNVRAGEWYISGAIPEGYYAPGDGGKFWIARPISEAVTDGLLLVISNHRESADYARIITEKAILRDPMADEVVDGVWTVAQAELFSLADNLKEWIELEIDDMPLTTFRDCVRAQLARDAFDDVDWYALARHCLERVKANDTI